MLKPICVPCRRFFRPKKSGYYFIEGMPAPGLDRRPPAGNEAPHLWTPYKLWRGDLWRCEGCGAEIVSGTGLAPIAEHYQREFAEKVARLNAAQLTVNDC